MKEATMKVLGISANSRLLALAIIQDNELHDFNVHLFKEKWSDQKVKRIIGHIKRCVREHAITNIALTIPYAHYQNRETKKLITQIKTFCDKKNCSVTTYSPAEFQCLCEDARAKKKALMKSLVEKYPELHHPYRKEITNKRRYYHKLFEAVAAGTLLARALKL
jgi:hypothetical protein